MVGDRGGRGNIGVGRAHRAADAISTVVATFCHSPLLPQFTLISKFAVIWAQAPANPTEFSSPEKPIQPVSVVSRGRSGGCAEGADNLAGRVDWMGMTMKRRNAWLAAVWLLAGLCGCTRTCYMTEAELQSCSNALAAALPRDLATNPHDT